MVEEMFCDWQIHAKGDREKAYACKPDDPKAQLFCGADLYAGRAYPCPYKPSEIYEKENGKLGMAHKKQGELVGICQDFKPPKDEQLTLF